MTVTRRLRFVPSRGVLLLACVLVWASEAIAQPTFSKVFTPDTIGPGGVSMLTFTITNGSGSPVTDLAFADTLPAGVTLADPANASTDCTNPVLGAPDGGSTITLSDGSIGATASCTVMVNVTSSTPGTHMNVSGDLTSSAGNSGTASDDLIVTTTLPGFSKSFAPSSVSLGGRSTLTFNIDNTANASRVGNLDFTDTLPTGMVIANPSNASTDCVSASAPDTTLIAVPGTSVIILNADGSTLFAGFEVLPIGATCTVTVDVVGEGIGMLHNVSGELLADFVTSGKAADTLEVTVTPLSLIKDFTDDPVPPGGTVTLEFKIDNFDRDFPATGVAFTDNLASALAGLTFDSLLSNDCGGSVTGVGTTDIGLTGGTVVSQGSCIIRVTLSVPAGATPGAYTNTTSTVTATVDGSPIVGNMASEDLFVEPIPLLTKEFLEVGTLAADPVVNPGDDVILRFTVTNTSATSMATDIAFIDELTDAQPDTGFLPFPITATLPPTPDPPCGSGSSLGFVFPDVDRQGLSLTGGTLDAAPGVGSSCTFDVALTIPEGFALGTYLNTTEEITATVDGATRTGQPASDTLDVIAAPMLTKSFTDDPSPPGGTVTLEFTLNHSPNTALDATGITFTDDLGATLTGLTVNLPPAPDPPCGAGSTLTGSMGNTLLTLMGGTLMPGEACTFSVTLDIPAGAAPGSHTNTTSMVMANIGGFAATSRPDEDELQVSGLVFSKEFLDNPVIPGGTTTLRFTIENVHPTEDATITFFTDNLQLNLPGLAATGSPSVDTCNGMMSGTTSLLYVGGSVMSGTTCTIEVEVLVPAGAEDDDYVNMTSSLSATQGGAVVIDPATDTLTVNSSLLFLTKEFTDDPVTPGGTATLEFNLTNLDPSNAASDIDFTDDLGAALAGLTFDSELFNDCAATVSGTGTDMVTVTGGSLAAGGACTIRLSLSIPGGAAPGVYVNTTSALTGMISGLAVTGNAASDSLDVGFLSFTKTFESMPEAGETVDIAFTIQNLSTTSTLLDLSFTDDLDAVISGLVATGTPINDACGMGSLLTGTSLLTLTGGTLLPLGSCTIAVTLAVPGSASVGLFPNTTSDLREGGSPIAPPATATLIVTGSITNITNVTADGVAVPVTGQTTDTIVP